MFLWGTTNNYMHPSLVKELALYRKDPKFLDGYPRASAALAQIRQLLEEQSIHGLHCLQFILYNYEEFLFGKISV